MKRFTCVMVAALVSFAVAEPCLARPADPPAGKSNPQFAQFHLVHIPADQAAARLTALLDRGTEVYAEPKSNTLYIRAGAADRERAREYIRRVDVEVEARVVVVMAADPNRIVRTSRAVLAFLALLGDDRNAHVVLAGGGQVHVLADPDKGRQVKALLQALDAPAK